MNEKRKELKSNLSLTDAWVFLVIFLFTFFVDVIYVVIHYLIGIQISDYWLVCNVIFYSVELIMITAVNIAKKLKPEQKEAYKEISGEIGKGIAEGVISGIVGDIQMPQLTSGAHSTKPRKNEEESFEDESVW